MFHMKHLWVVDKLNGLFAKGQWLKSYPQLIYKNFLNFLWNLRWVKQNVS